MSDQETEILKQGKDIWNQWRQQNPNVELDFSRGDFTGMNLYKVQLAGATMKEAKFIRANLSKADLIGADLMGADFSGADLSQANLSGVDLTGSDLSGANLIRADLREANLRRADLSGANLHGANLINSRLVRANLTRANLSLVDLSGADLNRAIIGWTSFGGIDLSTSKGLDTVEHYGPSSIGIDTIQRSQGKILDIFLRGTGVSETFITYITSLANEAIQYYSCFISYSSKDEAFAQRLHADLQQRGVRCWFAPEDMKIGDKLRPRIDESIRIHDKLLLILSENSLNSFWVESEVEKAFEEEHKRKQTVLFPVRLDNMVMETDKAWAADIRRTRHIGDFSRWKDHDAYQQAFERLLRDLKAERNESN